jgi:hypothetical protein
VPHDKASGRKQRQNEPEWRALPSTKAYAALVTRPKVQRTNHAGSRSTATASRLSPRGREHGAGRDHYRQSGAATIRATRPSDRKARSWFTIRGQSAHASAGSAWRKRKTRLTRGEAGRGNTQGSFRRVPDAQVPGSRAIGWRGAVLIIPKYGTNPTHLALSDTPMQGRGCCGCLCGGVP